MSTPLASARNGHTATLLPSGKLLVVGGAGSSGPLASAELLDPATGSWSSFGSLLQARRDHAATRLPSGKVLVTGGEGPSGFPEPAELYDPATGWRLAGTLLEARKNHTMTLLPSGEVLITGGEGSSGSLSSTEMYDPANDLWSSKGSLSQARASATATLLPSGKVLVVGGTGSSGVLGSAELYDLATGSWSSTGSLAQPRKSHIAMLLPSGKVLVAGGLGSSGPLASAELYDPATGSWSSTGSLSQARSDTTATLLTSGKVLVAGGLGSSGPVASTELYDPATGSWSSTLALSLVRRSHTATLLPTGKVLVVGGSGSSGPVASTELYNPAADSWTAAAPLPGGRGSHVATLLPSGKVLVAGGLSNVALEASAALYDPAAGSWSVTGSLTQARYEHTGTLLPSGKVLVAGGWGSGNPLTSAELYDPATGSWTVTGSLAQGRHDFTATLLPSGKVLVVGGRTRDYMNDLASAELYDPATGTWAATGSLSQARFGHTATLLPSGKVLVAGGSVGFGSGAYVSAELYDPATGSWSSTGSLAQRRYAHTATLLPSGKVLVVGGYGGSFMPGVELYDPATGSWTAAAPLARGRSSHTATLLLSGKVLVACGGEEAQTTTSELYDPATGSWTVIISSAQRRYEHTATLLPSGQVLMTGGYGGVVTSELYDDTGANSTWRPGLGGVSASGPLAPGSVFTVNGSLLRGVSEASGGDSRSSPTDFPFLTLLDLERGRLVVLPSQDFSSAHVTASVPLVPPGQYLLSVTVNGLTSSTVLGIAAAQDTEPPTAALTAPGAGATLKGSVLLSATALDNIAVTRVEFYDGSTLLGADTTPPYSFSWNTMTTANGPHLLTVKAYDAEQSGTSPGVSVTVDNDLIPPTVAITSPMVGATVTGTLTATATATDNVAVTRVEFYDGDTRLCSDTSAPYSCTWNTRTGSNGERTLTTKAYDAAGNMGVATVAVTANNDFTPPTVALTAPAAGATLTGTVTFTATASDASGISKVAFFVGSLQVGTATSAPYSYSYNTRLQPNGAKALTAKAYDPLGNVGTSAPVNVTFDNDLTPPTVTLTAPAAGATLTGTVTFTATASDMAGIFKVDFFVGSTLVGTTTTAPYSFSYNTRLQPNGAKALTAKAYDPLGNVSTSATVNVTFDNDRTPPTVTLTAPTAGATLVGTVALSATASDNIAVTHVEFYDGATLLETVTTSPYAISWDTRTAANGAHVLTAKAYDAMGQSTSSTGVGVTVDNDEVPPTVAFSAPAAGATVTGSLTLTATATDNVAVTRVEFYDGDTRLGTDTTSPYTYSWNTRTSPNGEHTLTAKAFDAKGYSGLAEVTVTVDNDFTPPTVALTAPAEGQTVSGTVVLSATASDNKAVTRVAFFVGTTQVGSDSTAPYSYSYNTRSMPNGAKVLTAKAYDAVNNMGTSASVNVTFDNDYTPPTVTLTAPGEGETLAGTVAFTATASDTAGISKVVFFAGAITLGTDSSAPYSFSYNTRSMPNGAKVLTAKAYDAWNNVGPSAPVNVTFDNDFTVPTTSITSLGSGSTLSGVVQIDAIASDDRGSLTKVDFYQGTVLLGTAATAPYTWAWDTTKAPIGNHTLKTRAWDGAGNSAYSTAVTVSVTR